MALSHHFPRSLRRGPFLGLFPQDQAITNHERNNQMKSNWTTKFCLCGLVLLIPLTTPLQAQDVGGHFGFVIPLVTRVDGETITVADDFVIGFPFGLGLKVADNVTFDMELVPLVNTDPIRTDLLVHPGFIFGLPNNFALGVRAAWEVDANAVGFTPLINYSVPINKKVSFYAELDLPVRWQTIGGETEGSFTVAAHFGFGF